MAAVTDWTKFVCVFGTDKSWVACALELHAANDRSSPLKEMNVHLSFSSLQQGLLRKLEMDSTPLSPNEFLFRHSSLRCEGFSFRALDRKWQPPLVMPQSARLYMEPDRCIPYQHIAPFEFIKHCNTWVISVFLHILISYTNTEQHIYSFRLGLECLLKMPYLRTLSLQAGFPKPLARSCAPLCLRAFLLKSNSIKLELLLSATARYAQFRLFSWQL